MSRGFSGNEKCVFCGWTRRNAYQSVRFFTIPKDPGLKRVRWLQVFGDREITAKDRVCSVHFRQGRPSSDPSHEDFVPHLYLNNEPPPEVLDYLESLADSKPEKIPVPSDYTKMSSPSVQSNAQQLKNAKTEAANRNPKPSILKRKRPKVENNADQSSQQEQIEPQVVDDDEFQINNEVHINEDQDFDQHEERPVKLTLVQKQIADAVGLKPGQTVIIRRRVINK